MTEEKIKQEKDVIKYVREAKKKKLQSAFWDKLKKTFKISINKLIKREYNYRNKDDTGTKQGCTDEEKIRVILNDRKWKAAFMWTLSI